LTEAPRASIRIDKWLWYARFFKTRGLAAKVVSAGQVRVDGSRVAKPSHAIGPGATLTFPQGNRIRVVRMVEPGSRRGPAPEAQALYEDLTPEAPPAPPPAPGYDGGGRPTKKDRRKGDALRQTDLE
jgi:ribosome-associated heat shock protein Hsp15